MEPCEIHKIRLLSFYPGSVAGREGKNERDTDNDSSGSADRGGDGADTPDAQERKTAPDAPHGTTLQSFEF